MGKAVETIALFPLFAIGDGFLCFPASQGKHKENKLCALCAFAVR
jgi:hypothetical protein